MHVGREGGGLARREAGVRYDLPATDKVLLAYGCEFWEEVWINSDALGTDVG